MKNKNNNNKQNSEQYKINKKKLQINKKGKKKIWSFISVLCSLFFFLLPLTLALYIIRLPKKKNSKEIFAPTVCFV